MYVLKRDGTEQAFDRDKIVRAVSLSALKVNVNITPAQFDEIANLVKLDLVKRELKSPVAVDDIHLSVENVLWEFNRELYKEYRSYNNSKKRFNYSFNSILKEAENVIYNGDKENANKDTCIISTKKEVVAGIVASELYLNYELPKHLATAHKNLDMYIHDTRDRYFNSINCCLFDVANLFKGGFRLNGTYIKEPKGIESALDLLNDVIMCASSQQYGGFTVPLIDEIFAPYVEKTYKKLLLEGKSDEEAIELIKDIIFKKIKSLQYKVNTVNNANGQTSFVTWTFGLGTDRFSQLITEGILEVRAKYFAIFPKLIYLHVDEYSGEGKPNAYLYEKAIKVTMKQMYPDYLSGNAGVQREVFDRTGTMISMMG